MLSLALTVQTWEEWALIHPKSSKCSSITEEIALEVSKDLREALQERVTIEGALLGPKDFSMLVTATSIIHDDNMLFTIC